MFRICLGRCNIQILTLPESEIIKFHHCPENSSIRLKLLFRKFYKRKFVLQYENKESNVETFLDI